jgi:hypothetical protein
MTTLDEVWEIPGHLCVVPHTRILTPPMERKLARMDPRLYQAGRVGGVMEPLFMKRVFGRPPAVSTRTASRRPPR